MVEFSNALDLERSRRWRLIPKDVMWETHSIVALLMELESGAVDE